ncbi:MAG: RNB domain-containing ribonuclease [Bacilli bacterium]|nr:RNB domain-containing ribonuclease [Bacilli bacterium]
MNIEKALRNYLKGLGPRVKYKVFFENASKDPNAAASVLFDLLNEEVDSMTDTKCLNKTIELINYLKIIISNFDEINRKIIGRRLNKLSEKLDRIEFERKKYFTNRKHIKKEFDRLRVEIDSALELTDKQETKQYDFMRFLVNTSKDFEYLEYTFDKVPSLVNVRDKDDIPLFRNVIKRLFEATTANNIEDVVYYENIISLILSQDSFELNGKERKICLDEIYKYICQLSTNKRNSKKHKITIEYLKKLVETIKNLDSNKRNIQTLADKYNIQVFFEPEIIEQAKLVKKPKTGEMTGRKQINDYIISIDGDKTYEIDDSLSCVKLDNGNYLLGVHIASILSYFPYDSEVVQNAIGRNQSIYLHKKYDLPDGTQSKTVPIFPYEFSTDAGSLTTGEPKFARSYYFEIDKDGNVVNEVFYKSIITNSRTTTFDEVNRTLKDGSEDKRFEETVRNLTAVADILASKNKAAYIYEQIKENTDDYSDLRVKNSGAQSIVYQAMMLTGQRVAEFFARNNYPFIYRVHEVNEENAEKLEFLIETLNKSYGGQQFEKLYHILEGVYPKGWYAMEGRHSGLGLEHYCHCTSGLRRAADIVAEHALEVCYDKTPTAEELEELRIDIEEKIRIINEKQKPIEWFAKEYKKVNRRHR